MSRRRSISATKRVTIFREHNGICHLCEGKIHVGEAWDVSHEIPLELGGADDETNWCPAHRKCHRVHTATVDQPNIAKAKRREIRHLGIKKPSAFRHPTLRKRMDGRVANRETGEIV